MTSPDLNILTENHFLHPGKWWHREDDQIVCDLCPRECRLREGDRGFCSVRQNVDDGMCGMLPAVIVMKTLQRVGKLNRSKRVGYATSGEVSGDMNRVVGYAGVLFS